MSGEHEQTEAQSILAAVGIVLALLVAAFVAYSQGVYAERRYAAPHDHAESAKARASRACARLEPAAMFECVNEEVGRSEETARTEQDLDAQQKMALWALLMVVVSAATAIIASIALWYVKGTLEETRAMTREAEKGTAAALVAAQAGQEANRMARSTQFQERMAARIAAGEARRERQKADARAEAAYALAKQSADAAADQVTNSKAAADRQLRPYLIGPGAFQCVPRNDEKGFYWEAFGSFSNQGATPAVILTTEIVATADTESDESELPWESRDVRGKVIGVQGATYTPSINIPADVVDNLRVLIVCRVTYRSLWGGDDQGFVAQEAHILKFDRLEPGLRPMLRDWEDVPHLRRTT